MIRWLFALLTLLCLASIGFASSCRARVVAKPVVVVKEAAAVAVPVVPVAIFAQVAAYGAVFSPAVAAGAVYGPPVAPAAPAVAASTNGPSGDLAAVLKALEAIDARLRRLEGGTTPPPGPGAPPPAPAGPPKQPAVFQAKCAACHESKVAAEKGGGFTLLEGANLAKLSDRQKFRVSTFSYQNKMPPRTSGIPALTDAEVSEILSFLDGLK